MAISNQMRAPAAVASIVVIAVSFILMARGCRESELAVPQPDAVDAWATAMAQETARLLGDGGQIVLASWDTDAWSAPARKAQRDGFLEAIQRFKSITLLSEERYIPAPDNPFLVALNEETLHALSQNYGDADLIVSLVGIPAGDPDALAALRGSLPPLLCTASYVGSTEEMGLESGLVAAVVMPSRNQPSGSGEVTYEAVSVGDL